ncbi:Glutamine synthetase [Anaerohalosphaera lusitana]|uniref:Glutamine synthetase n=1 Tax=Anaerohalosphaera lusitana TaxID=1936003 RepID=A0A1U9NNC6_9BACT|nr:glutamine synthetase III [Anaerohalosphaera lusitana]AQT69244.1 Glutamine synthetase [Anaerohalosphaera lusitana]
MSDCFLPTTEVFGSNVFNDSCMRERLPKNIYKAFRRTIENREPLAHEVADVIANAMKDWAIEKGATHFCHWFQPMTGLTAEKHDSFISPTSEGKVLMEFSGKELTKGEPDASSFPSGGLRATFEARGYTAWDCTSPVFVKEDGKNITLHIPSAFCSYNGDALDKKTPLLRSMDSLDKQGMRVLRALGNTTSNHVEATLGPEQEYFLIDKEYFEKRLDLVLAKRTLFGAPSPRGQEMDDHYFGTLHERVASFMHEVNTELWKLGVSAKTQHNEVSPAQYEIAPVFTTVNVATDHNQLTMEVLEQVALRHDFVCLLNEKPFAGVNGSGKHVNWSACTDDGINLLEPGTTPHDNMVFLLFLSAVIRGVDKYAKLMRASVANTGNEHRLGANEAPPAIVSIFLGDQLMDIFEQLANGGAKSSKQGGNLKLGASTLPNLPKDCTDRNRTSPFAFTGNKFEFRMPGSTQSSAGPAYVINTIVADVLAEFAEELEASDDMEKTLEEILARVAKDHKHVIFNGDNYTDDWVKEAEKRGLPNMPSTVEAFKSIPDKEHVELFERQKVLTERELHARTEILLEAYGHEKAIEAKSMVNMAKRQIMPAAVEYAERLASSINAVTSAGVTSTSQKKMLEKFCSLIDALDDSTAKLEVAVAEAAQIEDIPEKAEYYRDKVVAAMTAVRSVADEIETVVDAKIWPLPTYAEMLFLK